VESAVAHQDPQVEQAPAAAPPLVDEQPLATSVAELQRTAGNQAVSRWIEQSRRPLQRSPLARCACGGVPGPDGECAQCKAKRLAAERGEAGGDVSTGTALAAVAARRGLARQDGGTATAPPAATPDAGTPAAGADAGTPAAGGAAACALTTYTGSNFVGQAVVADTEFVDSLDAINAHAVAADVNLHVTSSFRETAVVPGAIVQPAQMSNHMAGHAIDMNVLHGANKGTWCNSTCLGGANRPAPVETFIQAIRGDAGLRWGGDFNDTDPVHIDDHLNADTAAWTARRNATQAARTAGCG
jgi:hypothetical protein